MRYVQVHYGPGQPWDDHKSLNKNLRQRCPEMDRASAALIKDLKQRGLLNETVVVWGGGFGRTPVSEAGDGRDHNPYGFTMFMASGGYKGGMAYGETDEFGLQAVEKPVSIHDVHATVLNQLGLNHEKLTDRYAGRDFHLTDVYGNVVKDIIVQMGRFVLAGLILALGFAAGQKADVTRGKTVFEKNCAACHDAYSTEETVGPGLKGLKAGKLPDGRKATHDELLDIINTGPAEMTASKDVLSEQEKEDVVAFLMTL